MRLVFPGQESNEVLLRPGVLSLGTAPECDVSLPVQDWLPRQASVSFTPERGIWLRLEPGAPIAHVNARPVHECALLRAGDLVALGKVRFWLYPDADASVADALPPPLPPERAGMKERNTSSRVVLRGLAGSFHGRALVLVSRLSLGRGPEVDVVLDGEGLPEHPLWLERHPDCIVLRAAPGAEAVRLNGLPVQAAILHPGDQLTLGGHRFMLEAPGLALRSADLAPAEAETPGASAETPPQSSPPETGRFGAWWLLIAAAAIAGLLTALLLTAPA